MTLSTKILGGVAGLALTGALGLGGSALAQSLSQSSAEEMAQTSMLNAEQDQMASQAQATIAAAESANQSAYAEAQKQFSDAQARYGQQLDDYNKQLQDYQAQDQAFQQQAGNFEAAKSDYEAMVAVPVATSAPADAVVETNPPIVVAAPPVVAQESTTVVLPERTTLIHLGSLPNPDADIARAPVEDRTGRVIGRFNHMTYVDEGQAKGLVVLNNNKMVAVPEENLRFDQDHAVVVADLSFEELNRLPGRL